VSRVVNVRGRLKLKRGKNLIWILEGGEGGEPANHIKEEGPRLDIGIKLVRV